MALGHRLNLRLTQRLILTPQLQQTIKLLQMPQLELAQALNQELVENPFLQEILPETDTEANTEADIEKYTDKDTLSSVADDDTENPFESDVNFGIEEYFAERSSDGRDLGYFSSGTEERPSPELLYSKELDLYTHLLGQLRLSNADDNVRKAAEVVIGNIDDNGYLRATEEELVSAFCMDIDIVRSAIALVHDFDPPGVGARNLKECLLLQLNGINSGDTLTKKIVNNNIDDLYKKKYSHIAKQHGADMDDVMAAVKIIEGLEPMPGRSFYSSNTNYIIPDVFINKTDEGYQITLNEFGMPRLVLNNNYRKLLLKKEMLTKEEMKFLREKLKLAKELIKSLDQRNRTIYKVSESILKVQRQFFDKGLQHLRPLNLRDVALDINMHESTISRVTSNKFLTCSHGVFNFRFFFSSKLQSHNGGVSSTPVKNLIKKMTAEEEPQKPLSDQTIADRLKEQDINIARRTVAKYREELKILPQNMRKKTQ